MWTKRSQVWKDGKLPQTLTLQRTGTSLRSCPLPQSPKNHGTGSKTQSRTGATGEGIDQEHQERACLTSCSPKTSSRRELRHWFPRSVITHHGSPGKDVSETSPLEGLMSPRRKQRKPFEDHVTDGTSFVLFTVAISVVELVNKQTLKKTQRGVKTDLRRADNCTFRLFTSSNKPIPGVTFINKRRYQVPDTWLTEINYPALGKILTSPQCCNICAN